jgi:hypothetical protein
MMRLTVREGEAGASASTSEASQAMMAPEYVVAHGEGGTCTHSQGDRTEVQGLWCRFDSIAWRVRGAGLS